MTINETNIGTNNKIFILLITALLAGCSSTHADHGAARATGHGAPPELVAVTGGNMTLGFASGVRRTHAKLSSFRVTKHPITVRDYQACVSAGSCAAPQGTIDAKGGPLDRETYGDPEALDVPVTGVRSGDARNYCAWVGGRLPSASEWLLAARGPSVHRFPWGDDAPVCSRYPIGQGILADLRSCCATAGSCTPNDLTRVGTHPQGASPAGLEDVLFSRGELVDSDPHVADASCGGGTCVVAGNGAAIEGLVAAVDGQTASVTFRCAFPGGSL